MPSENAKQADTKAKQKIAQILPELVRKTTENHSFSEEEQAQIDTAISALESALEAPQS